ncbi:MAG: low molecular weight protein-tyrosine-phosphatase [Gammaproteobacteria bacterium]
MIQQNKINVLFVCMGNICRSPSGEGVFRHYVEQRGETERFWIDSAGTYAYHVGQPADKRMRQVAAQRGYSLDSIARKVELEDLEKFDLVVPMDSDNLYDLESLAGGAQPHIRLLGSFLDGHDGNNSAPSVPDPYYGGMDGFEIVLDMIEQACPGMFAHCLRLQDEKA